MRIVAIAAAAGLGLLCVGTFVGSASAMVGVGAASVQAATQEVGATLDVAAKKKMKRHARRHHGGAASASAMSMEPHFGGAMRMGKNCWVDPDGRGVTGYWTACK